MMDRRNYIKTSSAAAILSSAGINVLMKKNRSWPLIFTIVLISGLFFAQNILAQKITKGPYIVSVGESNSIIRWELDKPSESSINFSTDKSYNKKIEATLRGTKENHYLYEVRLNDLSTSTQYYYYVLVGEQQSSKGYFKTKSLVDDKFSFVAMGDSRSNPDIFQVVADQVNALNPELIISMGDLVENGGTFQQWGDYYFSVAGDVINHIPLISTLGDHEGDGDNGDLFRHYLLDEETVEEQWFSYDMGEAHFISLDYRHPNNEKMIEWFKKDIAQNKRKWNFVYMHRPCYNLGGHRSAWGTGVWPELFRENKIDIVFAGHSHLYERFFPLRPQDEPESWPVTYITTGGAGAGLYEVSQSPYLAKAQSVNHFLYFDISGDTLEATTYLNDGSRLDQFTIIKTDEGYNAEYLALVKPQSFLSVYGMFAKAISFSISDLPMIDHPASANLELISLLKNEDIPFEITLSTESSESYKMEPVKGVLIRGQTLNIPANIFNREGDLIVSGWGNLKPMLRLTVKYSTSKSEEQVSGSIIDYWPDEGY